MKKLLFLFSVIFALCSCNSLKFPYMNNVISIDYSEYEKKNFFITESNSVNFNYSTIASLSAISRSGYEITGQKEKKSLDDSYNVQVKTIYKYGDWKVSNPQDALKKIYEKCIELGANALINVKIQYYPEVYSVKGDIIYQSYYVVTGMAVKK